MLNIMSKLNLQQKLYFPETLTPILNKASNKTRRVIEAKKFKTTRSYFSYELIYNIIMTFFKNTNTKLWLSKIIFKQKFYKFLRTYQKRINKNTTFSKGHKTWILSNGALWRNKGKYERKMSFIFEYGAAL